LKFYSADKQESLRDFFDIFRLWRVLRRCAVCSV